MPSASKRDPKRFLGDIWIHGIPESQSLLVWCKKSRLSIWCDDLSSATTEIAKRAKSEDVYIGVGCGSKPRSRSEKEGKPISDLRLSAEEINTFPGLVADLDVEGPGHKKKGLFKSKDEACAFLRNLRFEPTLIVDSGGGTQGWWLFHEPWELESPEERARLKAYSYGWYRYVLSQAQELERIVDPVWDLARILRPPGTLNHKSKRPRAVKLLANGGPRRDPDDFEVHAQEPGDAIKCGDLILDPGAMAPRAKLEALLDVHEKFKRTWLKKRDDELPSSSEYEMALANILWGCGWEKQEIADGMIEWRRRHGLEPKLRASRYESTIGTAISSPLANKQRESLAVDKAITEAAAKGTAPNIDRERTIEQIKQRLGIPIETIRRYDDLYIVRLISGVEFKIPGDKAFMRQEEWRAIAGREKIALRYISNNSKSGHRWGGICSLLYLLVEDRTTTEITSKGGLWEWIGRGIENIVDITPLTGDERSKHIKGVGRFKWGVILSSRLGVHVRSLHQSALDNRGVKISASELQYLLQSEGFQADKVSARSRKHGPVTRSFWWIDLEVARRKCR